MSDANPFGEESAPNPYGASASTTSRYAEGDIRLPENEQRGLIGHIPVIGVLMIVQGVLLAVFSVFIGIYSVFMPQMFDEMQRQAAANGNAAPMPPGSSTWIMIVGLLMAFVFVSVAILTIFSGIKVFKYRGRSFAIIMLCTGMISIMTCYCFPTGIALAVYGLIVMLNNPVKLAFDLCEQGYDPREVQKAFLMLP